MADLDLDKQPENQPEAPAEPKDETPDLEPEERSIVESEKKEPEQPEDPDQPEQPEDPIQQEQPQMSRRKAKRLEKLEGLVQHLRGTPQQQQQQRNAQGVDYRKLIDADEQVYQQLDQVTQNFGQTQYQAGLQQANSIQFHTRLEIDAPRVENKYEQFNRSSPEFNPSLASAVNEFYLGMVGYDQQTGAVQNPNLRYESFVDALAELGEAMFSTKTTQSTQNIARQAANAGLRPDGSSAKPLNLNKAPEEMTDEELRAAAKASMPRDSRGRFTS